ncbi:MAG TPA: hypothetical protein VIK40_06295, partial [Geomonas sp.]
AAGAATTDKAAGAATTDKAAGSAATDKAAGSAATDKSAGAAAIDMPTHGGFGKSDLLDMPRQGIHKKRQRGSKDDEYCFFHISPLWNY